MVPRPVISAKVLRSTHLRSTSLPKMASSVAGMWNSTLEKSIPLNLALPWFLPSADRGYPHFMGMVWITMSMSVSLIPHNLQSRPSGLHTMTTLGAPRDREALSDFNRSFSKRILFLENAVNALSTSSPTCHMSWESAARKRTGPEAHLVSEQLYGMNTRMQTTEYKMESSKLRELSMYKPCWSRGTSEDI